MSTLSFLNKLCSVIPFAGPVYGLLNCESHTQKLGQLDLQKSKVLDIINGIQTRASDIKPLNILSMKDVLSEVSGLRKEFEAQKGPFLSMRSVVSKIIPTIIASAEKSQLLAKYGMVGSVLSLIALVSFIALGILSNPLLILGIAAGYTVLAIRLYSLKNSSSIEIIQAKEIQSEISLTKLSIPNLETILQDSYWKISKG